MRFASFYVLGLLVGEQGRWASDGFKESNYQKLKVGENPADTLYSLPDGSKWNGDDPHSLPKGSNGNEEAFTFTHFLHDTPEHEDKCLGEGGARHCVREVKRTILVERGTFKFSSPCRFSDCFANITIPDETEILVDVAKINDEPLFNTNFPPFRPSGPCHPSTIKMFVPGSRYRDVNHYRIFLKVQLKRTFYPEFSAPVENEVIIKARMVLEDGSCDSVMSHKFY
ncbi:hypothetical protein DSO57_1011624 [Entomophthora muscae]|uniref:Uncharacterized protein n=1 Tax=Entomophthora muscae TaxID=34485 RepID=A0ACC2URJ6_9FUNG|nr:hypothetical protein DSO57_1011624 [Entomophthora muscae]